MRIVPVIDLKDGAVVHARQGRRDTYQPIASPLCASSDVYRVLDAFL
jgi:phosphoribosylformimino-5-aminoimidazole carboxamide ribotide isomerase